jgi:uncharacterized phiE125 gp8 family phage protein
MKATIVTPPTGYPVTLAEMKTHLRVDTTSEDGFINSLVMQATNQVENILNRKLVTQTWKYFLDAWPDGNSFELPFGKLQSVTSVKYKDSAATEYTMASGDYIVDTDSDPGRVVLDYGVSWPSETLLPSNPIYIQFVCGYGAHTVKTLTNASNAAPIVVSVGTHGYTTGDRVLIEAVLGNTAANGTWILTSVTGDTFSLNGSTGNSAYTSGGKSVQMTVPEEIRHAIKMLVGNAYEHRESIVVGMQTVMEIPGAVMNLLWPHRLFWH